MNHLRSFTLLAVAALAVQGCAAPLPMQSILVKASEGADCRRLAQPGDQKIQIYCRGKEGDFVLPLAKALPAGEMSCRRLARTHGRVTQRFCGSTAEWDQFDTRAVATGVTCRLMRASVGHPAEELCLATARWESFDRSPRRGVTLGVPGSNWPGNSSLESNAPTYQGGSGSYGFFPQGTAIGATTGGAPPR